MIKITKRQVIEQYKTKNPFFVAFLNVLFGIVSIAMCIFALCFGIVLINSDLLKGLVVLCLCPIVFAFSLPFGRIPFIMAKEIFAIAFNRYTIVKAKCTKADIGSIDTEDGEVTSMVYTFGSGKKELKYIGLFIYVDHVYYLAVIGKDVLAIFDTDRYYTDNFKTLTPLKRNIENKRKSVSVWILILEYLLFGSIALDVFGVLGKDWILALCGGNLMVFYILGSLLGGVHRKATGIITILYLFINGILFYYLSYTYNHSIAAYIVGTAYILVSLIIFIIWINIKSKNKK